MTQTQLIQILTEFRSLPAETEVIEFKEAKNDYNFIKLGKYFSALSNEANLKNKEDAWLVFGVENTNHFIVGSNYRNDPVALSSLKGEIAGKTTNRITFIEIYELNMPAGRVVMFQIPAAPQGLPVAWDGHYYGRDGEELSPLNLEEIERIRRQAIHIDWSAAICPLATINDLDFVAISVARGNFKVKNPRLATEMEDWDDATFLNKAKICINGQITRTAIILLGKPEAEHHISPAVARITWILKDKDNVEKDYEHFTCPLLLEVDKVYTKIRNLKYRYIKEETLFPDEVDQYAPFNIREALSNCIVHQNYSLGGRINIVEREDAQLIFTNHGEFLPGSIESVIESNEPPGYYRNSFLAHAMVNLNMIDTVGSGIKRMFRLQRERFFPMPDYDFSNGKVRATLTGKVLDIDFTKVLARNPDLSLEEIIMLDKVQKGRELNEGEIRHLKGKGLIEGRKPNFHISASVAEKTEQKAKYILSKGIDDDYCKKIIEEYLRKFKKARRADFENILRSKLPDILSESQKSHKVKNLLQAMKNEMRIRLEEGKIWVLNNQA